MTDSPVGWDADPDVSDFPRRPALSGAVTADVCVVGLGGSGLAAIGEALRRGLTVVGLDAGRVAAGAAGRNGGLLAAGPALGLTSAVAAWGMPALSELYQATRQEIDALADLLGPTVVRRTGGIRVVGLLADSDDAARQAQNEAELADCAAQQAILLDLGVATERYDGPLGRGLFLPEDATINPARRALAMAQIYEAGIGGTAARLYENSPATEIKPGAIVTAQGSVSAGLTVVAVDGRLEVLLPELVGRVRTARLQMLATDRLPTGLLPHAVHARWGYDYAQQDSAGRLFVGGGRDHFADQEWTLDTTPTSGVQRWIETVAERLAGGPIRVSHRWAASVGFTPDKRPLVVEVRDRVVACGGYSGTGNLVGPIAARAALALGLDGTAPAAYFAG